MNYYIQFEDYDSKYSMKDLGVMLGLFFIMPFAAWIYALTRVSYKSSYVIFFLFSLLICWHFAPTGYNDFYDDFLGILDEFLSRQISTDQIMSELTSVLKKIR